MGFSIKLAPGVRIRASSRGLRTSIGPRAARVHVGGGRTGFSTGVGPISFYTSTGGGRSRSGGRSGSTAAASRSLAAAQRRQEKAEQGRELLDALQRILSLHREEFQLARPPVAPPPPPVDVEAVIARHRKAALAGIGILNRAARAQAKAAADQVAQAEVASIAAADVAKHVAYQAQLDQLWARLLANDPDVVLGALAEAFEDNEAAAAPVGVSGGEAGVAVLVPSPSAVPERKPDVTPAGNLTLKKLTKRESSDFYRLLVCGYLLATVKEAFAVAPGLTHVRVVALRVGRVNAYGKNEIEAILGARFAREALHRVRWDSDATTIVQDTSTELTARITGPSKELNAIDLSTEPELAALVQAVDFDDLNDAP